MLLELQNIKKYFKVKKSGFGTASECVRAVDDINLNIIQGENLSLVGESGCGKTTLGRLIVKLLPSDSGRIFFEGQEIISLSCRAMRKHRKHMQMVFQDPFTSLDPRFTVRNIIQEAMIYDKTSSKSEKQEKIIEILKAVHLSGDVADRFPHEFSGGERQRIAIARALVMNPKLLILDEAVSSLDVLVQAQIIDLLLDIQKKFNVTYLFISHNLRVVKKIASRVAVMYKGRIVEIGSVEDIFNHPMHQYTKELLSAAIDYKVTGSMEHIILSDKANLVDCGNGHFILE